MQLKLKNNLLKVNYANTFKTRLLGYMGRKNIKDCLCFPKCSSIHTFFMKENIDVIMTDKNNKVLYVYNNFKKNKIILPKKNVYYTYELPNNTNSYKVNDILNFIL